MLPLVPIVALLLTVVCLWLRPGLWPVTLAATVALAYGAGVMHGAAVAWLLILAASASTLRGARGWTRVVAMAVTAGVGLLLGTHRLPGFVNVIVIRETVLASGGLPYSQYVNFDKTLAAVVLLACAGFRPMRTAAEWRTALVGAAPWILGTVAVTMTASLALGFVRFEPHWSSLFWIWAAINLLTTCVSEEAFFCAVIQQESERALTSIVAPWRARTAAIVVGATLFGLAHLAGGWRYALLAALAGGGYATAYRTTGRLEMAIATHFMLNTIHFTLFTYPALA